MAIWKFDKKFTYGQQNHPTNLVFGFTYCFMIIQIHIYKYFCVVFPSHVPARCESAFNRRLHDWRNNGLTLYGKTGLEFKFRHWEVPKPEYACFLVWALPEVQN